MPGSARLYSASRARLRQDAARRSRVVPRQRLGDEVMAYAERVAEDLRR